MGAWKVWLAGIFVLVSVGSVVLSLTYAQERGAPASSPEKSVVQVTATVPARDLSKLSPLQQQMYLTAQRGGDWLCRANRADGRFVHGYLPDLKSPLEGDHYLRQAGAAYALAQVASLLGEERYAAVARQAVLTLLLDTALDPNDAQVRRCSLPGLVVNRLGAAAYLVLAINELPAPGDDLLEQSEQLCVYIAKQRAADGSLRYIDGLEERDVDPDAVNHYPGQALYALMRSQRYRPAAWKLEVVRKALPYYQAWWRAHPNMAVVPWHTAAYTEAYLQTKEKPFADFVFEMNDWLCSLQYARLDPRHPLWLGGFMEARASGPVSSAPQVGSAQYAEALTSATRLARSLDDPSRCARYRTAVESCLQFLTTLQYTEANTQHFADWYRPVLLGGFHASQQDGNLRIDYTQQAVCALVKYLLMTNDG
jgi:hypothetical protein